jgi:murein DD-endopeptidase MepM/ murein hydrolase activator NlpD
MPLEHAPLPEPEPDLVDRSSLNTGRYSCPDQVAPLPLPLPRHIPKEHNQHTQHQHTHCGLECSAFANFAILSSLLTQYLQSLMQRLRIVASLIFVTAYTIVFTGLLTAVTVLPANAQNFSQPTGSGSGTPEELGSRVTQAIPTITHNGVTLPDWSKINLNSLPAMAAGGKIEVPSSLTQQIGFDLNATWQEGDKITSVIKAGHLNDLGVGSMSLNDIDASLEQAQNLGNLGSVAQLGNMGNAADLPLGSFDPASYQSMASLTQAIPGLGDQQISTISPFADLVVASMGSNWQNAVGQIVGTEMLVGDFINQYPDVASLKLGETLGDLSPYSVSDIPGLDATSLDSLEGWGSSKVEDIPGLGDLPMEEMEGMSNAIDSSTWAFIAKADVPLTTVEQDRKETVSGSFQAGFQVPCDGEGCAHLELTPIGGSQMDPMNMGAFANGKAWISGTAQLVPGGEGALKAVNGGLEPTGRNPYGSTFKQAIINIDEPSGTAMTALFFRYCHPTLGCTPYVLGPVPFLVYPEKMLVFLGVANPVDTGKGINLPGSPLRSTDGFKSCGGGLSGDAVDKATAAVDVVAQQGGAFSTTSADAAPHISRLMKALKDEGITCPTQVAYILGTIHAETSWVNFGEGATASASDSQGYHGRGYIQHTHIDQYQNIDAAFGTNTVANPDLLMTDMDLAARAAARSFKEGWTGNGKTIDEAIPCNGQVNFVAGRGMINDNDKSQEIAQAAQTYYDALSGSEGVDKATETAGGCSGGGGTGKPVPCPEGQTCKLHNPLPSNTGVYSGFGYGRGRLHAGVDMQSPGAYSAFDNYPSTQGAEVLAAYKGTVNEVAPVGGTCGGIVGINHPDLGLETRYIHMIQVFVQSGQQIERGQPIGIEGTETYPECSQGIHLHYEIYSGGAPIDPFTYEHEPPLYKTGDYSA